MQPMLRKDISKYTKMFFTFDHFWILFVAFSVAHKLTRQKVKKSRKFGVMYKNVFHFPTLSDTFKPFSIACQHASRYKLKVQKFN